MRLPSAAIILLGLPLILSAQPVPATRPALAASALWFATFSADGRQILTAGIDSPLAPAPGGTAMICDLETGAVVRQFFGHIDSVNDAVFSPDGKFIATAGGSDRAEVGPPRDPTVRLWDTATGREIRTFAGHLHIVQTIQFSPDGKQLLSSGYDHVARLWSVESGRELFQWPVDREPHSASFNPLGGSILTRQTDRISIWNPQTGKEICHLAVPGVLNSVFESAHFSPDGKLVVTASGDKTARTWNAQTGEPVQVFTGHAGYVKQARFSEDGKLVLTASGDKTVRLWDVATGKELAKLEQPGRVFDAVLSPDAKRAVARWLPEEKPNTPYLAGLSVWDLETGKELRRISSRQNTLVPSPALFTPDGKAILVHVEKTELLNARTGETIREY